MSGACAVDTALEPRVTGAAAFSAWKETTSLAINRLIASANTKNGQLSTGEQAEFEGLQRDVYNTLGCLQEKHTSSATTSNSINEAQTRILQLQEELKKREEEIQIAKDRVAYIRDPDAHPSYYQSWFPMDHPMKPASVSIFIGIIVFASMFIFLGLLSFIGIDISIVSMQGSMTFGLLQWIRAQLTPMFLLVGIALIATFLYYYRR
jgi:hypothetical protein